MGMRKAVLVGILMYTMTACGGAAEQPSATSEFPSPVTQTQPSPSPEPSPTPIDPAAYKASAKSMPYVQLEKDPDALAGTVVTFTGQVVQFDSATGPDHLRINVTKDDLGFYDDTIWLDVDPAQTANVYRNTVIQFWGEVVGAYTYTSVSNAKVTIPEVQARFVTVVG